MSLHTNQENQTNEYRRKFLAYLKQKDLTRYQDLIKRLGLRS